MCARTCVCTRFNLQRNVEDQVRLQVLKGVGDETSNMKIISRKAGKSAAQEMLSEARKAQDRERRAAEKEASKKFAGIGKTRRE